MGLTFLTSISKEKPFDYIKYKYHICCFIAKFIDNKCKGGFFFCTIYFNYPTKDTEQKT